MSFSIESSILAFLAKQTEPVRKSAIIDATGYAPSTISNAMPKLTGSKFVAESRGYYVVTYIGKQQLEADPFFTTKTKKTNSILIEIPISDLTHLSQQMISSTSNEGSKESLKAMQHRLQTLAILYAVAANVPLPKYKKEDMDEADKALGEKMSKFINELLKS